MATQSSILAWKIPWTEELTEVTQHIRTHTRKLSNFSCIEVGLSILVEGTQVTSPVGQPQELSSYCILMILPPFLWNLVICIGLPRWLSCKEFTCQCRRCRFDPWSGRYPGEGNCNPLQYSCQGNPMDRKAWQATVHGVAKESDTTQRLNSNRQISFITDSREPPTISRAPSF